VFLDNYQNVKYISTDSVFLEATKWFKMGYRQRHNLAGHAGPFVPLVFLATNLNPYSL